MSTARHPEGAVSTREVQRQLELTNQVQQVLGIDDEYRASLIASRIQMERMLVGHQQLVDQFDETLADIDRNINPVDEPDASYPFEMSHDVAADTQKTSPTEVTRTPHEDLPTRLVGIVLGAATGAKNAVGVRLTTTSGARLVPRNFEDDFLGIPGGFADSFALRHDLVPGEDLVAEAVNLDTSQSHFVTIIPQVGILPEVDQQPAPGDGDGDGESNEGDS